MKLSLQKLLPHLVCIFLFIGISLSFFYPILQGKRLQQSDIVQYTGMAKERNDFREIRESYWTNSAFGGMPTYQLGAEYPHNYIKKVDKIIRFLPRPADYLFLYFISFYILLLVLKIDYKYAFWGALAYGFSTYLIIILTAGHNAKAHAIGYFGFVLAGILVSFQRKYLLGFLLTAIGLGLEINANHFQMTYYLLLLVLIIGIVKLYEFIKNKELKIYFKTIGILSIAVIFSVLLNATNLLATKEYSDFSTRGKSELTLTPDGLPKSNKGLSKKYITEYSYGISESLNLIVPRLFGGSNSENIGEKSQTYQFLSLHYPPDLALNFAQHLPIYWGEQPIVAAPAYIGIIVFFFFILGLFIIKNNTKYWLLAGAILSLLLSWGKNFSFLTNFMIDFFPMYDKFRAVSSIQVILELCLPVLASMALYNFIKNYKNENYKKYLLYTFGITISILIFLLLFKDIFSFSSKNDVLYSGDGSASGLVNALIEDRKTMYINDLIRSILFTILTFGVLYTFYLKKINEKITLFLLSVLILLDMVGVANRYLSEENYVSPSQIEKPFQLTENEELILKDKTHFRVFSLFEGLNGARTSYFFHSIGGYHAAKPKKVQELFDYQIYKNNNQEILNMLNTKYFIQRNEQGAIMVHQNEEALGNAWFVENILPVANADKAMQTLDTLSVRKNAITTDKNISKSHYPIDSTSTIQLQTYTPDKLTYISNNINNGFAVFSEIYYPYGWQATIDGQKVPIYEVNYTLRGLEIPAGKHSIEFIFEPEIVKIGSKISLISSIILLIISLLSLFFILKKNKTQNEII
ncbi:MAG: YfhO family protein [Capnocytophaga sp.]|nr:YfhO family protein [Capnocytophaga sp.]